MKSKKIVFSADMEEIYKVIADFSITINLLFRIFSKQASTLAALTARGDGVIADSRFVQDPKKFRQNCPIYLGNLLK